MRSIKFAGLARILHLLRSNSAGLRAGELSRLVESGRIYRTGRGSPASPTTLYHCRNTLLQIGAVVKHGGRYYLADRPEIDAILHHTEPDVETLGWKAKGAFADLVLQNRDCQARFFRLFGTSGELHTSHAFREHAAPVCWAAVSMEDRRLGGAAVTLNSQWEQAGRIDIQGTATKAGRFGGQEIASVLYGIRYWAKDELGLVDEYFQRGRGSVMFPVRAEEPDDAALTITNDLIDSLPVDRAWTTLSLQDLIDRFCVEGRHRLVGLHVAIGKLASHAPGKIVLIPSAESFAANTLSATFPGTRAHELGSYYRDGSDRLISHVRLHVSISRNSYAHTA
jgi:hypothetical protein